ncbi:hypothetical protein IscW_ISCW004106 [Ixodes scapularis]|uniref:Uncharacterized protein n=1 Tax=Ixodes scapularis TaxID=6945 RepID=B7PHB1_IXOSC|nr:hypothetical protein IscW_ISCW004106 [Ixodes scapularis]|eukprot:XP_002402432.1 hypothetical protein IscW_ISCW004106 [Ixodes scapularis]
MRVGSVLSSCVATSLSLRVLDFCNRLVGRDTRRDFVCSMLILDQLWRRICKLLSSECYLCKQKKKVISSSL